MKKLLVIGKNWPEPKTTAAGYRLLQLLEIFQQDDYEIHFSCASQKSTFSADLRDLNIQERQIHLNDSSFDDYIYKLMPDIVLYDRFMTEEQYGWRVREKCPNALQILDTEDLHLLRKAREVAFKKKEPLDLFNETAFREIAAIHRCDLSIIISSFECRLLKETFDIAESKIFYLPFLHKKSDSTKYVDQSVPFSERANFVMIGNSLHEPNYDAIVNLKTLIWPLIRKQLPTVEVHIYGAYQSDKITQLHNKKEGFIIKGFAEDVSTTLSRYRLLLAPLRFGAGLKGKIFDALKTATPVAMTSIAAEAMFTQSESFGFVEDDPINYAKHCVELYTSVLSWNIISNKNLDILESNYLYSAFAKALLRITTLLISCKSLKNNSDNFSTQMLNYHSVKGNKYMSKWIEEKNAIQR